MKLSAVNLNQSVGSIAPQKNMGSDADIQALKKKLQELQEQKKEAVQRKDVKEKQKLEKQIAQIRKQIEQLEKSNQNSEKTPPAAPEKATDRFERQVPQQSAGVYKISRDDMGRPVVQTDESRQGKPDRVREKPDEQGDKPTIVKTTLNTDQVDREIDKLKQTQTKMEQQIAATKDEKEKQALQTKLEQVKAELKMKDNDAYRRQHMQITEQKVVSRIGE